MHKKLFKIIFIITHTWVLFNLLGCTEKVLPLKKGAVSGRVYDENNLSVSGAYITSHRSMLKAETDNYADSVLPRWMSVLIILPLKETGII
jgi:hypothetical protein